MHCACHCLRTIKNNYVIPGYRIYKRRTARYNRHIIILNLAKSPRKIKSSKVLIIGSGGLGSPALLYLWQPV
jgi:adenylyltransferase/sulfurtransferase